MQKGTDLNGNFRNWKKWSEEAYQFRFSKYDKALMKRLENKLLIDLSIGSLNDIREILDLYGSRDLFFVDSTTTFLKPGLARNALNVYSKGSHLYSSRLYLIDGRKCSIPLLYYLLASVSQDKEGHPVPPEVIEEWSGIPSEKQEEVYKTIVGFLRRGLTNNYMVHNQNVLAYSS
jgi:hypothetical protein